MISTFLMVGVYFRYSQIHCTIYKYYCFEIGQSNIIIFLLYHVSKMEVIRRTSNIAILVFYKL